MFGSYNMGTLCTECWTRHTGCIYFEGALVCWRCHNKLVAELEAKKKAVTHQKDAGNPAKEGEE